MTSTLAPTPAATCSGVRLKQSQALGKSGHILIRSATTSSGGLFRMATCKKDMPLNSEVAEIILDKVMKAFGFWRVISLNCAQFLLSMMPRSRVRYDSALALRLVGDEEGESGLVIVMLFDLVFVL